MKCFHHFVFLIWTISVRACKAEELSCHGGFLEEEQAINLGQKWDQGAMAVHIDLSKVTSTSSSFELRTFDPEGVLFFGDNRGGDDWFLLGLKNGRPHIQIHNQMAKVTVSGGPKVNDGKWHKVLVRSEDHRIILEVDEQEALRIGHVTERVTQSTDTIMRILVGGIMTNYTDLLEEISISMDGCLRNSLWLNETPEWLKDPAPLQSAKPCFSLHRRGSYFPGTGRAIYKTSDIIPAVSSQHSQWHLSLQMQLHSQKDSFSLLGITNPEGDHLFLTLRGEHKTLVLELGNTTALSLPVPDMEACEGALLLLEVTHTSVSFQFGGKEEQGPIPEEEYTGLRDAWQKGGYLNLGGQPDNYFHGCLKNILIQGSHIDLDSAIYKSDSIWSHSCPQTDKDIK